MPNARRRRFSVQHDIGGKKTPNPQTISEANVTEPDLELKSNRQGKNKSNGQTSKNTPVIPALVDHENSTSTAIVEKKRCIDKDVTATSSAIEFYTILASAEMPTSHLTIQGPTMIKEATKIPDCRIDCNCTHAKRERYRRQHRAKVRSPKRRVSTPDRLHNDNADVNSVGTNAIDWDQEIETLMADIVDVADPPEEDRHSDHSSEDMCRICHGGDVLSLELGQLISACSCRGTVGRVHVKCLERWLTESGKSRCELCGTRYDTMRVHRYGIPRALIMWILSQNAKQLMVDSLGIMLMSPLAILAAWLSGRTLAGLMAQDNHATPWPLASTFVLACMTLVCYYCWIVSAATRHALGWWLWYRSQYEVRLLVGSRPDF